MIKGHLGAERYEIQVKLSDDTINGRIGGSLMAQTVKLTLSSNGISGQVGGSTGFAVQLSIDNGELTGFIGNDPMHLRGVDMVIGALGDGFTALEFQAQQNKQHLRGSIGGLLGKPFDLELSDAPGWLGALLAVIAFYASERHKH